jgi:hypothetical protein
LSCHWSSQPANDASTDAVLALAQSVPAVAKQNNTQ